MLLKHFTVFASPVIIWPDLKSNDLYNGGEYIGKVSPSYLFWQAHPLGSFFETPE